MSIDLFFKTSFKCSKLITHNYSTSFSLGIRLFKPKFRDPIYAVYGFVRYADEIVDTFHDFDKSELLERFRQSTYVAIDQGISLNPILNSFQKVVREYDIDMDLINAFLDSMAMDLSDIEYNQDNYENYIYGSAEVVGLMCLKIFVEGDQKMYDELKRSARYLGSAFQKVNFLRDINSDYNDRGRTYFPNVDLRNFNMHRKREIERDIHDDFAMAKEGILKLPSGVKLGVYVAYIYYLTLFDKIKGLSATRILTERIRVHNFKKILLLVRTYFAFRLKAI